MSTLTENTTAVPAGTFHADTVHSSVEFGVQYMGIGTFTGSVSDFEASLVDGKLEGKARISSLVLKDENLLGHLLSPEFFDAERHPEVTFSGTAAEGPEVAFVGEITIKGVTQPATLTGTVTGPVTDPYGNERVGLKLETTIDRTQFGITWNNDMPNGEKALDDSVTLKADLALVKQA